VLEESPAMMARMENVEVVVAHQARATVRVGEVFLKIDADQAHLDTDVAAIALSPIPAPEVLWQQPSVLALRAVPGTALGRQCSSTEICSRPTCSSKASGSRA
jgi:hypothetical protein